MRSMIRGGIKGGPPLVCASKDRLQHAEQVAPHLVIPESQYFDVDVAETDVARPIFLNEPVPAVLVAVDFNRQSRFRTIKVDNELSDWMLPTESQTTKLAVLQPGP